RGAEMERVIQALAYRGERQLTGETFYRLATETIDEGYRQMFEVLLPELDRLLGERSARARGELLRNLALFLGLLLVVGYLAAGAYRSVLGSIMHLREGSERLAAGDLTVRIHLEARDAVASMEQGVDRVGEGGGRARRAGEAMAQISEAAEQVVSRVAEISHALREQSSASGEIARQVGLIARMTGENDEAVASNHQTARRLGELSGQLQD